MNIANWVRQEASTIGQSAIVLTNVVVSFIRFSAVFADQDKVFYSIVDGNDRENGYGTYISASNSITRDVIFETLVSGAYNSSSPAAIYLSGNAVVSVMPTTKSLLTHDPVWKALYPSLVGSTELGYTAPGTAVVVGGIRTPVFDATIQESLGMTFVVPNDIKPGSDLYPVIKWFPTTTDAGTVRWGIEYSIAKTGSNNFTTVTTKYIEQVSTTIINNNHAIEFLDADKIASLEPEAVILIRVFRDAAHANDTYTADAGLVGLSLRYQSTMLGTPKRVADYYNWSA